MIKSFFPEEMTNSGELSLDIIKGKLHYFEIQFHELHWQTTSLAEHLVLGDSYELVYKIKDNLIEKMMGYTGIRTKATPIVTVKNYSPGMPEIVINELLMFSKQLENYGKLNNMPDVEDIAVSLSGHTARLKYRLTLS